MPMYRYRRQDGTEFDYRQSFQDDPLTACPTTGQPVSRIIQAAGIVFKGSGFYVNDSKGSKSSLHSSPTGKDKDTPAKDTAATEGTAAPAKAETKTETPKAPAAAD